MASEDDSNTRDSYDHTMETVMFALASLNCARDFGSMDRPYIVVCDDRDEIDPKDAECRVLPLETCFLMKDVGVIAGCEVPEGLCHPTLLSQRTMNLIDDWVSSPDYLSVDDVIFQAMCFMDKASMRRRHWTAYFEGKENERIKSPLAHVGEIMS